MTRSSLWALVALMVVAGCKGGRSQAAQSPGPSSTAGGTATLRATAFKDGSVALSVPNYITDLTSSTPMDPTELKAAIAKNSWLAEFAKLAETPSVQYYGIDLKPEDRSHGFSPTLNVTVNPGPKTEPTDKDLEDASKDLEVQFKDSQDLKHEVTKLASGSAIHYSCTLTTPSGMRDIIGYGLVRNGKVYTMTLSLDGGKSAANQAVARQIAESIQVK